MTDQADTPDPIGEWLAAGDKATAGPWLAAVGQGPKRRKQQTAVLGIANMRGQGEAGALAVFAGLNEHRADDAEFCALARDAIEPVRALVAELAAARDREAAVRADTYRDAADEIRREARWQTELKKRGMPDDVGGFMHRLLMLDRLLRDRAALSQSEPTKETDHA